jgi:dipeptidyl-peptidase 4
MIPVLQRCCWTFLQAVVLIGSIGIPTVMAQSIQESDWQTAFQTRLRGIYEKGEWRAKPFRAQWLPDSSGYIVTERQGSPEAQRRVVQAMTGEIIEAQESEVRNPMLSPDGKRVLEIEGSRLGVRVLADGVRFDVARADEGREVEYYDPRWSSDGKQILFSETDVTEVRKRSVLIPGDPSFPEVRENRFARIGEAIPKLRVGVFHIDTRQTLWLPIEMPPEGFYLGQVEWAGNDREVLVETLSRFRDTHQFHLVNVEANRVETIYSETNDAWADASQGKNQRLIWLKGGQEFLVLSEKSGWRQATLHQRDGKEIATLTPGEYDIIDRGAVDESLGCFYFYASPENGTQKYLYRVPLDGRGELERVTPLNQPGTHEYQFAPNAKLAFHTFSSMDRPPVVELVELPSHRTVRVLEANAELRKKAEVFASNPTEFFALDIGGGVSVDAWMMKPSTFDPSKRYPVFVYVYGEPHAQTVLDSWGTSHDQFHRAIAELGYLVVSIDNRGTPCPKGAAWRRSIFGSLGPLSTEEQSAALQALAKARPYVDASRVGIWGWSGGGSNTLNALFRKPEQYHVGIAVVPKPQPHLYNAWFQEIYMRTPKVNPDGYQKSAPIHFAEGLKGKLLIITGSGETNTHIQIIEGLVDRLIELGKPFDYMVYPNRDHGLREGTGSEVHVRMLIVRYLIENLPRGGR